MSLLSEAKIANLRRLAALSPDGAFAEVGVYKGGSLLELAKIAGKRKVFGFDTFQGLPKEYDGEDEMHPVGDFNDKSLPAVKQLFVDFPEVYLVEGLFPRSALGCVLPLFAFVHLDMDYWRGTIAALHFFWPRLVSGGCILFDDYEWVRCPGIAPVVETWAASKDLEFERDGHQAWIYKV